MDRHLTRRTFAAATMAATTLGLIAPALRAQEASPEASPVATDSPLSPEIPNGGIQADGSWAFTDDRGVTLTLPQTPTKVVAFVGFAAALYDLGYEVAAYYGGALEADGSRSTLAGNLPLDRIPSVSGNDGADEYSLDVEKLVALGTELFIGPSYGITADPGVIWPFDASVLEQVGAFAQVMHVAQDDGADVERTIETMANLAGALGVDLAGAENAAAKDAFDTAKAELQDAIAAKPNLTTLWIAAQGTGFWVQSASYDITYLQKLGAQFVGGLENGSIEQSWETFATSWAADLIFIDVRQPYWWGVEQLTAEVPTFALHPAVAAGQVAGWYNTFVPSYAAFTPIMQGYTEAFLNADETIVP